MLHLDIWTNANSGTGSQNPQQLANAATALQRAQAHIRQPAPRPAGRQTPPPRSRHGQNPRPSPPPGAAARASCGTWGEGRGGRAGAVVGAGPKLAEAPGPPVRAPAPSGGGSLRWAATRGAAAARPLQQARDHASRGARCGAGALQAPPLRSTLFGGGQGPGPLPNPRPHPPSLSPEALGLRARIGAALNYLVPCRALQQRPTK